jgi:hypothetical protein
MSFGSYVYAKILKWRTTLLVIKVLPPPGGPIVQRISKS